MRGIAIRHRERSSRDAGGRFDGLVESAVGMGDAAAAAQTGA